MGSGRKDRMPRLRGLFDSDEEVGSFSSSSDEDTQEECRQERHFASTATGDNTLVDLCALTDSTGCILSLQAYTHLESAKVQYCNCNVFEERVSVTLFKSGASRFQHFDASNGFVVIDCKSIKPILEKHGFQKDLQFDELEKRVLHDVSEFRKCVIEILELRSSEDWPAILGSERSLTAQRLVWASSLSAEVFWEGACPEDIVILVPLFHADKTRRVSLTGSHSNPPAVYYPHIDLLPDNDLRSLVFSDFQKRFMNRQDKSVDSFTKQFDVFIEGFDFVARNMWISLCESDNHHLAMALNSSVSKERDFLENRRVKYNPLNEWFAPERISFGTTYIFDTQRTVHTAFDRGVGGERLSVETRFVILSRSRR